MEAQGWLFAFTTFLQGNVNLASQHLTCLPFPARID
jgi:hypothetical protein